MNNKQEISGLKFEHNKTTGLLNKRHSIALLSLVLLFACSSLKLFATDWKSAVNMKGYWQFSVGDDKKWASPDYNDKTWDRIYAPKKWEDFYPGYNGYAWYRKTFDMKPTPNNSQLKLMLGRIDDVDEVYINGVKIGQSGSFFPNFKSAYDVMRQYDIPEGILKKENNVIAIRVLDFGGEGGIITGNQIGIFYDNDVSLLTYNLSGNWKFSTYRQEGITNADFDDSGWDNINVPGRWEDKGYKNHDGYGWYRKTFILPTKPTENKLFLIVGKIDDFDKVYLNGKLIGRTEQLEKYRSYNKNDAWLLYRVYEIPQGLLRKKNTLVVEVNDKGGDGGIYEGPVGLANYSNAHVIMERGGNSQWGNILDNIKHLFNID